MILGCLPGSGRAEKAAVPITGQIMDMAVFFVLIILCIGSHAGVFLKQNGLYTCTAELRTEREKLYTRL